MKPELLLPAGNIESFYAALEGGADAIYFGLQDFNARQRAKNFTMQQVPALVSLAAKKNVKLFVALNIVIKNQELPAIFLILHQLQKFGIDGIIIQDLGALYLIKKHFPKLKVHASTQMAIHNSAGALFAQKSGIDRIVLARELTINELSEIRKKAKNELEVFVHGALCYSFSGMCNFSSYLGGMSANRGACKQPCRRLYTTDEDKKYIFSLKDNELIEYIPRLAEMGINSLKVEGRLKSGDYVYTIARAYRMVIDNPESIKEARQVLKRDIGREKTTYFIGGKTSDAISQMPNTGMFTGYVVERSENTFVFTSFIPAEEIERVRICSPDGQKQQNVKLENFTLDGNKIVVETSEQIAEPNDLVYITGFNSKKFSSKLPNIQPKDASRPNYKEIKSKVSNLVKYKLSYKPQLYVRIDSLAWLKSIRPEQIDLLILNLPFKEWAQIPVASKQFRAISSGIIAEFPKFIAEENIDNYKKLALQLTKSGIDNFMVSHISQISLVPAKAKRFSNENVYVFNDAAAAQLEQLGIQKHIFPVENDFKNLLAGSDRSGIVPLYYYPQLFYSRIPVEQGIISDDNKVNYRIIRRDGITVTIPLEPVSIVHEKHKLSQKGFKNFLIDLSFIQPSQTNFDSILNEYRTAGKISNSSAFNFKEELK
jgi:putative protease